MFEKDKYIGTKIGRLFVENIHHIGASRNKFYNCVCDCGKNTIVARSQLSTKQTISCGCYREEHKHEFGFKHGMSNTKIYHIWSAMCQRCANPKADNYHRYGGRGIKIYDEWFNFIDFYKWALSNGYKNGLSIERIDVNGNYCPENCAWIPVKDQYENKRNTVTFTFNGITHSISRWAKILNVNRETLSYRIKHNNFIDFENFTIC